MNAGKLYGVSVGPGDPELLTFAAARALAEADCLAAPDVGGGKRTALGIVGDRAAGKRVVDCTTPMTRDPLATARAYDAIADELAAVLDEGKTVAFVTLGDASVYSTWPYVRERMEARGYRTETVPGVPSFCAAAARLGVPLCERDERLTVAPAGAADAADALSAPGTKVFMKAGRKLGDLQRLLRDRGAAAGMVANCGLEGEVVAHDFCALQDVPGYMSVVIARDGGRAPGNSSAFFQNTACEHFPCHEGIDPRRFNCLFCYCPLYALGDACGGAFEYTDSGVKACTGCTLLHDGDGGAEIVRERFPELKERAARS